PEAPRLGDVGPALEAVDDVEERKDEVGRSRLAGRRDAAARGARPNVEEDDLDNPYPGVAQRRCHTEAGIGAGVEAVPSQEDTGSRLIEHAVGDDGYRRRAALEPPQQGFCAEGEATDVGPGGLSRGSVDDYEGQHEGDQGRSVS